MKTIFVVGAGQGLGNRVAERFSEEGFRVVLMARNPARLQEYKAEFENKGIEAHIRVADAASPDSITQVFGELKQEFGVPDVLFYNVGNTTPDVSLQEAKNADLLMKRYQADVAGTLKIIFPSSAFNEPQIRFKSVVLPLPFEPITETNSPLSILKLKSSNTVDSSTVPTLKRFAIF